MMENLSEILGPGEPIDPGHDVANDEQRFPYPFTGTPISEVRVTRNAMARGEDWVKDRIEGWFRDHEVPKPGTSIKIENYQLDPNLFQPGRSTRPPGR
jgi:hypothetical protein